MRFDFATANRILFGVGRLAEIPGMVAEYGHRPLVVSGQGGANPDRLLGMLEAAGVTAVTYRIRGEPSIETVEAGLRIAKEAQCDVVIGFGGGSVIDCGKAIAGMLANPGELLDYLEVVGRNLPLPGPALPYIAIPTTAGTGAEVTRNAVLAVREKRFKVSLRSPYLLPRVALVDPELTLSLSPEMTASTGMDALTQVIEPFVSIRANPFTDLYCRDGIQRAARSLLTAYRQGDDLSARTEMCMASLEGGLALANAGLGAVHGFAAPIGGMFDAPHGAVCACLLPAVVQVNIGAIRLRSPHSPSLERYRQLAVLLTGDDNAAIQDSIPLLTQFRMEMKIPGLASYGIRRGDFTELVERAARASSMKGNPVELTQDEMTAILEMSI